MTSQIKLAFIIHAVLSAMIIIGQHSLAAASTNRTAKPIKEFASGANNDYDLITLSHKPLEVQDNQKLALQIFISTDEKQQLLATDITRKSPYSFPDQQQRRPLTSIKPLVTISKRVKTGGFKRPYDEIYIQDQPTVERPLTSSIKRQQPVDETKHKNFYFLDSNFRDTFKEEDESEGENFINHNSAQVLTKRTNYEDLDREILQERRTLKPIRKTGANQRSELVRTQHRPPWRKRPPAPQPASSKKYNRLRFTTVAPFLLNVPTTTEFFKLISSAHSPIRSLLNTANSSFKNDTDEAINRSASPYEQLDHNRRFSGNKLVATGSNRQDGGVPQYHYKHKLDVNRNKFVISEPTKSPAFKDRSTTTTTIQPNDTLYNSLVSRLGTQDGRILSPTILVNDDDEGSNSTGSGQTVDHVVTIAKPSNSLQLDENYSNSTGNSTDARSHLLMLSNNNSANEMMPTTHYSGSGANKRPVTIIRRHFKYPTTKAPALVINDIPDKIKIIDNGPTRLTTTTTTTTTLHTTSTSSSTLSPPTHMPSSLTFNFKEPSNNHMFDHSSGGQVRLIAKQKHKYDDNVTSQTLTVVDHGASRLPPNSTSVHNNKLIVAIRPGRPKRRQPPTTQFPVYNIVAGVSVPPYQTTPTMNSTQYARPPSIDGSFYGLLKPNNSDSMSTTTMSPFDTFGAPNIKFPAASPHTLQVQHESPPSLEFIDKVNISVPNNANMVGPNRVPDKLHLDTSEQHFKPPPDKILVSDNNNLIGGNRPFDLILRPSTTRRPVNRQSTTKRINIVSANTTVVTTSADELHDVLSDVIAGSHQQSSGIGSNNRPTGRPGILDSLSNILNAGVTTSAVAVLTVIKTIFMALLLMFLPPIALTAAIMQVVSIG